MKDPLPDSTCAGAGITSSWGDLAGCAAVATPARAASMHTPVARSTAPAPPKSREWPRRQPTLVRARLGRRVTPVNGLRSVGTRPLACHDCSRVRPPVRFSSEFDPQVQVVLPAVDVERPRLPAAASGTEFLDRSPT